MAVSFAFPIDGDKIAKSSRTFQQPVDTGMTPLQVVSGLELLGNSLPIYASFEGTLLWNAATGTHPERILLRCDPDRVVSPLRSIQGVEAPPSVLVYENVDPNQVETALEAIVRVAYGTTSLPIAQWHPLMRHVVFEKVPGGKDKKATRPTFLKDAIDEARRIDPSVDPALVAQPMIAAFVNGNPGIQFAARAGELIGATTSSGLIFRTIDNGGQFIYPIYYFNRLLKATTAVSVVSSAPSVASWKAQYTEITDTLPPHPRVQVGAQSWFNLRSDLDIHDPKLFDPALAEPHKNEAATIEWSYLTTGIDAEKIAINGVALVPNSNPKLPDTNYARDIWQQAGVAIAGTCERLQVPCETVVGIISGESQGKLDAYVFLQLSSAQRQDLENYSPGLAAKYERILGVEVTSYKPTRQLAGARFGDKVVTSLLDSQLSTPISFSNEIRTKRNFLIDDVFKPEIVSHSPVSREVDVYRFDIAEERLGGTIVVSDTNLEYYHPAVDKLDPKGKDTVLRQGHANFADVAYQSDRAGLMRVLRVRLVEPAVFDVTVSLIAGSSASKVISTTITNNNKTGYALVDQIDIDLADPVAIRVQTTVPVKLEVEWFLGLVGADGAEVTDVNFRYLPGAGPLGSGKRNIFNPIPNPWIPSAPVRTGADLTWGDVADMLDHCDAGFMVLGVMQAQLSTAVAVFRWIDTFAAAERAQLNINPPKDFAQKKYGNFLRDPDDFNARGWLLKVDNAIFIGVALMRYHYRALKTRFDLPEVSGAFLGGSPKKGSRWGANMSRPDWGDIIGRRYNDMVERFNAGNNGPTIPSVRFKR